MLDDTERGFAELVERECLENQCRSESIEHLDTHVVEIASLLTINRDIAIIAN